MSRLPWTCVNNCTGEKVKTVIARNICFLIIGLIVLVGVCVGGCSTAGAAYRASKAYCEQEAARAALRELSPYEQAEWLAQRGCNVVQAINVEGGKSERKQ